MNARFFRIAATGLAAIMLIAAGCYGWAYVILVRHHQQVEAVQRQARSSHQQALEIRNSTGQAFSTTVSSSLVRHILNQLQGLESTTRRGARIRLDQVDATFDEGQLTLETRASVHSRLGLLSGPIQVTYVGVVEMTGEGLCALHFLLRDWDLSQQRTLTRVLAPIAFWVWRDRLQLPPLELPLHMVRNLPEREIQRQVEHGQLTIRFPARQLSLPVHRSVAWISADHLGLVLALPESTETMNPGLEHPASDVSSSPDLSVDISWDLLNRLLATLSASDADILVHSDRLEKVWSKQTKWLGGTQTHRADVAPLDCRLNIVDSQLEMKGEQLWVRFHVQGTCWGQVQGNLAGVGVNVPFRAQPELSDTVPFTLNRERGSVEMVDKTFILWLPLEVELLGRTLKAEIPLTLDSSDLSVDMVSPLWVQTSVRIPTRVHRKKVVAYREVPLKLMPHISLGPGLHVDARVEWGP